MKTKSGSKYRLILVLLLASAPEMQAFSLTSTWNKTASLNTSSLFKKPVQAYFKRDPILIGCEIAILVTCIYIAIELYKNNKNMERLSKKLSKNREALQKIEHDQAKIREQDVQITTGLETIYEEQQKEDQALQRLQDTATPNSTRFHAHSERI